MLTEHSRRVSFCRRAFKPDLIALRRATCLSENPEAALPKHHTPAFCLTSQSNLQIPASSHTYVTILNITGVSRGTRFSCIFHVSFILFFVVVVVSSAFQAPVRCTVKAVSQTASSTTALRGVCQHCHICPIYTHSTTR